VLLGKLRRGVVIGAFKHDHTLAIVDPATLKVVAKMPVGDDPHEVIATADGKMAYVSNYGGGGVGALHTLAVIDLVNQKALARLIWAHCAPAWIGFCGRESLVHGGGGEGIWERRSGERESGFIWAAGRTART